MIVVELLGGIGNQMFQYALGRNLSLLHNQPLKLDLKTLNKSFDTHVPRKFTLDRFNIQAEIASDEDISKFKQATQSRVKQLLKKHLPFTNQYQTILEPHFHFDENVLKRKGNLYLKGYWQSYCYFSSIREQLLKDFALKNPLSFKSLEVAEKIRKVNAVSVHIRRGDYISNKETNRFHGVLPVSYYENAISTLVKKIPDAVFFIFSDDINWSKNNLNISQSHHFVDANDDSSAHEDMHLMSLCKHHVIANSSFSWWGAWLSLHNEKVVIAPQHWFSDPAINTSTLIPPTWMRL